MEFLLYVFLEGVEDDEVNPSFLFALERNMYPSF